MSGTTESSCHVVMIPHFVLVLDILSILSWIIFEGPMTETIFHCAIVIIDVLWCHDESFVVVVVIECLLFELDHGVYELLYAIRTIDHTIRFIELRDVCLYIVSNCARLMVFVDLTPVSPSWSSFLGDDECFKIRVDYERCSCAIAEIAEGELTPLPRFGHHE